MCGRFVRAQASETYGDFFGVPDVPAMFASYNIAPTQQILAIRMQDGAKAAVALRWGLIPSWAKDKKTLLINARADTLFEKPAFRAAAKRRRCLIPADGYYEWKATGKTKQPYYFRMADDKPLAFAGIWESWDGEGEPIESCSIVTTDANEMAGEVHNRMPAMLRGEQAEAWMDPSMEDVAKLAGLLKPYPPERMTCYAVGTAVGNVKNNGPECIKPTGSISQA